ncbi:MAG: phage portal protein [Sedimentisphaerales bacterium]|nr:phage portal protein [Sedimentisphaerales bacterium]
MAFDFSIFGGRLDEAFVDWLIRERSIEQVLHFEKLWRYYTNEMCELSDVGESEAARPYRQAQEYGLPGRITGLRHSYYGGVTGAQRIAGLRRKEVVIENDIAWRVDTLVDFLFGKPISIASQATDKKRAGEIETLLNAVFERNGGETFFQEIGLLGSVYGFVDVILRLTEEGGFAAAGPKTWDETLTRAKSIILEVIEAPRSLPILNEDNYKAMDFYVQHFWKACNALADAGELVKTTDRRGQLTAGQRQTHEVEVIGPDAWQRYSDGELVGIGHNVLGCVPVVHIQNMVLPGRYEGQSDVEPLMPLQDELNTRLSDRANRVTFQSFKMYLGKGIEGFEDRVVGPGRMWSSENPDATIEEFGGDPGSPSEQLHIQQVRESLEKASGVASIAAGILKGRIGNLTSAVALKVTLMGVLAKTQRKRRTYGKGIEDLCGLILRALDVTGIYPNDVTERDVDIIWPSPLPENVIEKLQEASLKKQLGVEQEQILKEIGY